MRIRLTILVTLGLLSTAAHSACECKCMDGHNYPVCSNPNEVPPVCPQVCATEPPATPNILTPQVPAVGATTCEMRQVWNPATRRYEWQRVCQ